MNPAQGRKTYDGDGARLHPRRIMTADGDSIREHCPKACIQLGGINHDGILDIFNEPVVH